MRTMTKERKKEGPRLKGKGRADAKASRQLLLLCIPAIIAYILFNYIPMGAAVIIPFKNYKFSKGILGSDWCGLANFKWIIQSVALDRALRNTVLYGLLFMVLSPVTNVIIALLLFEITSRRRLKTYQTIITFPNFMSMVIVGYSVYAILSPRTGLMNQIIQFFGGDPVDVYMNSKYWPFILTVVNIWKGIVTAFQTARRDVGDIFATVCPCCVVALCAQQRQKFVPVPSIAHTLVDHAHQLELPAFTPVRRVVFRVGHSTRLPLLISLEFRQPQFFADLVIANAQRLNLRIRHMYFFTGFKIDAVDDTVGVNVFAVNVGADQNFTALEVFCQPPCGFVRRARVNICALREALHHVIKHHAAVFVVQQLRTQKLVERRFRLTANAADELLSIPERLTEFGNVAHDTFHTPARLRPLFIIHEMDDCDFATPPSCIFLRAVLILENSCTAESKLANCTLPMFASTVSWFRLLPMAFWCRRTSFRPSMMTMRLPRQQAVT